MLITLMLAKPESWLTLVYRLRFKDRFLWSFDKFNPDKIHQVCQCPVKIANRKSKLRHTPVNPEAPSP